jgi:hypothetical protein
MTMECKACRCDKGVYGITAYGVCYECQTIAVAQFIAAREAEKAKAPTLSLEEKVSRATQTCLSPFIIADIIALVREHDGTTEWKDRAEKAEGKLAAMRSELST